MSLRDDLEFGWHSVVMVHSLHVELEVGGPLEGLAALGARDDGRGVDPGGVFVVGAVLDGPVPRRFRVGLLGVVDGRLGEQIAEVVHVDRDKFLRLASTEKHFGFEMKNSKYFYLSYSVNLFRFFFTGT